MALLNKITIRIFSCVVLIIAGIINSSGFNNPRGIVLNLAGTRAYITNYGNSGTDANSVSVCTVDPVSKVLTHCRTTGNGFTKPTGVALNREGTKAFISNGASNGASYFNLISECSVNASNGELTSCSRQLALTHSLGSSYNKSTDVSAWVSPSDSSTGLFFSVFDNSGLKPAEVVSCFLAGSNGAGARACALIATQEGQKVAFRNIGRIVPDEYQRFGSSIFSLFVTEPDPSPRTVTEIQIGLNPKSTNAIGFSFFQIENDNPDINALGINPNHNMAYLNDGNTMKNCPRKQYVGTSATHFFDFTACRNTNYTFSSPKGIASSPSGTEVYVTNSGNNSVTLCSAGGDGALTGCDKAVRDVDLKFLTNGTEAAMAHTHPGLTGTLVIKNLGDALSGFSVKIPQTPNGNNWFLSSGTCPIYSTSTPPTGTLPADGTCTLKYRIPSNVGNTTFNLLVTHHFGDDYSLPVTVSDSTFTVTHNDQAIDDFSQINLQQTNKGTMTFHSQIAIPSISFHLSNSIRPIFKGSCLTTRSMPAGGSCSLTYRTQDFPFAAAAAIFGSVQVLHAGTILSRTRIAISATKAINLAFVGPDGSSALNSVFLKAKTHGSLTLRNRGGALSGLRISVPAAQSAWFPSGGTCPRTEAGGSLAGNATCTIPYNIPANVNSATFDLQATTSDSEASLPVNVSTLDIAHNGHPLDNDAVINIAKGSQGTLTLSSAVAIPQFHLRIDPAVGTFFQGTCLTATSLEAGQSCSLDYFVKILPKNATGYIVASTGEGQTALSSLRINLGSKDALSLSTQKLTRYNRTNIIVSNGAGHSINDLTYTFLGEPDIRRLSTTTCTSTLKEGASCTLSYIPIVNANDHSVQLRVSGDKIVDFNRVFTIDPVPVKTMKIKNKGGYVMAAFYPELLSDGTIKQTWSGSYTNPNDRTIHAVYFNDPQAIPDSVAKLKDISIWVVTSLVKTHLTPCNGSVECYGGTSNPWCEWKTAGCH